MFKTDNPICNQYAQTADGFIRAGAFVLLSIQQPFEKMPEQMADVDAKGADSKYLWGMKGRGYADLREHGALLLECTLALRETGAADWREHVLTMYSEHVTGLGLAKAGFLLQLVLGECGCLDTHNLRRYELDAKQFKTPKKLLHRTRFKKARLYVETCDKLGGSAALWDSWCTFVAELRPAQFPAGPHEVSLLHAECLGG